MNHGDNAENLMLNHNDFKKRDLVVKPEKIYLDVSTRGLLGCAELITLLQSRLETLSVNAC